MNQTRLNAVTNQMRKQHMAQLIVSDPASIYYLTGEWIHPGERLLVLYLNLNGAKILLLNALFPLALQTDSGLTLKYFKDTEDGVSILAELMADEGDIGVDKNWPARFLLPLMEKLPHASFINGSFTIDSIRMVKDQAEQHLMRKASALNDQAMQLLQEAVSHDATELELSAVLKEAYRSLGADDLSFTPIIAFGANAALPHHDTGSTRLKPGDAIICDIGCVKEDYCSDMTRTFFYKTVSDKAREVYELVRKANLAAIEEVRPGARFCDIDAAARKIIEEGGYGPYFTHRTGHAIGLEVHEFGDVSSGNTARLEPGMIFSIEPGIYLDTEFGVRIEDLVLVTDTGCEVLNHFTKDLVVIG
ncbi:M24 family metallopeptidase [Acidaminobacter hydrogenoformans]|uniref:Xaa-Pro dipeptidase n=1 Tax=Acidaminobacter hydrogenoformans DSM 2784 TaxID=1120920 RepID=A0A1G5RYS3_9FIRM|nr:Xaa-Pro peptidase family protein [Acidaminobacter hydrogenoformans]SCZ79274.1 Xaa-Pro dipeptidase [Acidaminobacter hydrogenoformans DSM 2784]